MKNDEGGFCNFELCEFVDRFPYYSFMDSFIYKSVI